MGNSLNCKAGLPQSEPDTNVTSLHVVSQLANADPGSWQTLSSIMTFPEENAFKTLMTENSALGPETLFGRLHKYLSHKDVWKPNAFDNTYLEIGYKCLDDETLRMSFFREMITKYDLKEAVTSGKANLNLICERIIKQDDINGLKVLQDVGVITCESLSVVDFMNVLIKNKALKCYEVAVDCGIAEAFVVETKARKQWKLNEVFKHEFYQPNFLKLLQKHGIPFDLSPSNTDNKDKRMILHYLAEYANSTYECAEIIVSQSRSYIEEVDKLGQTPLLATLDKANVGLLKALLAAGADTLCKNNQKRCVLFYVLSLAIHNKLNIKTQIYLALNEYYRRNGKDRFLTWKMVQDYGGIFQMMTEQKTLGEITNYVISANIQEKSVQVKGLIHLCSHFCAVADCQKLQEHQPHRPENVSDYGNVLRKLRLNAIFWIKVNLAKRFSKSRGFNRLWIENISEFLVLCE